MAAKKKPKQTKRPLKLDSPASMEVTISEANREPDAFIAEYVALMSEDAPMQMAQLAAQVASPSADCSPTALVSQAIALRAEAERAIPARRAQLLGSASYELLHALSIHLLQSSAPDARRHADIVEEVIKKQRMASLAKAIEEQKAYNEANRPKWIAKLRAMGGPLPPEPFQLEPTLRWALGVPESTSFEVLEGVFLDFLAVCAADHRLKRAEELKHRESLEGLLQSWSTGLAKLDAVKNPADSADHEIQRKNHEKVIQETQAEIARIDALAAYVNDFTPGAPAPEGVDFEARHNYGRFWAGQPVHKFEIMEWLAMDFRAFCENHSKAYGLAMKSQALKSQQAKAKAKRKEAAQRTNAMKAHAFYIKALKQFLETRGTRSLSEELDRLQVGSKPSRWKKPRNVVGSIMQAVEHEHLRTVLPDTLKRYDGRLAFVIDPMKSKLQSEVTAEECLALVAEWKNPV